jgi:hypothetical protein
MSIGGSPVGVRGPESGDMHPTGLTQLLIRFGPYSIVSPVIARMSHDRKLAFGGVALVKATQRNTSPVMGEVR